MRLSKEQYAAVLARHGKSKYGNRKKEVAGKTFDSSREASRYQELLMLEQSGLISDLKCQVPIACVVNNQHVCDYKADFVYKAKGVEVHEDSKGHKTEVYRIKKKLVRACTGIEILET